MGGESGWSDAAIEQLKVLWPQPLSTAEIGRRLGLSKNAVVGKAHRLGLQSRLSPIRYGGNAALDRPRPPARPKTTLPALVAAAPAAGTAANVTVVNMLAALTRRAGGAACRWPIGNPGDADFRSCDAACVPGKPYCGPHCSAAYVPRTSRLYNTGLVPA